MSARRAFGVCLTWACLMAQAAPTVTLVTVEERRVELPLLDATHAVEIDITRSDAAALEPQALEATVLSISGPGGAAVPPNALIVSGRRPGLASGSVLVELRPQREQMLLPGAYTARLRLQVLGAADTVTPRIVSLVMNSPPAMLDANSRVQRLVMLERRAPWDTASGTASISLELEGRRGVENLTATLRSLSGPLRSASSASSVQPAAAASASARVMGHAVLRPGEPARVDLKLAGLADVGSYDTTLVVHGTGFETPVQIPVTVQVRDGPLWPFVAIFLGVIGGLVASRLRTTWKERQQARLRLLRAEDRLERLASVAREVSAELTAKHLAVQKKLVNLRELLDEGLLQPSMLTELEQGVDELSDAVQASTLEVLKAIYAVQEEMEALRNSGVRLAGEHEAQARRVEERVTRAQVLTRNLELASARGVAAEAAAALDDLQQALVHAEAVELGAWPGTTDAQKKELASAEHLVTGRPVSADHFLQAVQALAAIRSACSGGASLAPAFVNRASAAPASARPRQRLELSSRPPLRMAEDVTFRWVAEGARVPSKVTWNFGDGFDSEDSGPETRHRYSKAGKYTVKATAEVNGQSVSVEVEIEILRTQAAQDRAAILQRLGQLEWGLLIVSGLLATGVGMSALWVDKPFGTVLDYLFAFGWGFGVDQTVRSIAGVRTNFA